MVEYREPPPKIPEHPEYRLVHANAKGLLAVVPVSVQRGPKAKYLVVPIVTFNGSVFVVETYHKVEVAYYTGPYVTVAFEDGYFILSPEVADTATFDLDRKRLMTKAGTVTVMATPDHGPVAGPAAKKRTSPESNDSESDVESDAESPHRHPRCRSKNTRQANENDRATRWPGHASQRDGRGGTSLEAR